MKRLLSLMATCAALLPACAESAVGGFDYAPQYDFSEFYAATNHKTFQVIVYGNPFPTISNAEMRQRLLAVMQVNRPRPRLTFTYSPPAEEPHPWYRMVLVFDPANDLTAERACNNRITHKAATAGKLDLFAVYCRNDQAMSQALANAQGVAPEDRTVSQMFGDLFRVLFTEQPMRHGHSPFSFR